MLLVGSYFGALKVSRISFHLKIVLGRIWVVYGLGVSSFVEGFRAVDFEFDSPKETKEGTYNDYLGGKP